MDENKLLSPVPISFPPAPKTAPTVASDTTFPKVVLCPCMVRLTTPPTTLAVPAVAAVANRLAPPVSPAAPPVIKPCNAEPPTAFQSDISLVLSTAKRFLCHLPQFLQYLHQ